MLSAQYVIWHSPRYFVPSKPQISIESGVPSVAARVKSTVAGSFQWIELGLNVPSDVKIDSIRIYYHLRNSASFITQVRTTTMTTPDMASVLRDDPTDLTDAGPTSYTANEFGIVPEGIITLSLALDIADPAHWIDIGGIAVFVSPTATNIETSQDPSLPANFLLKQNFPNPFNPGTTIEYDLKNPGPVHLRIYNSLGQIVRTLLDENRPAGKFRIYWDGQDDAGRHLSSGQYYYELKTPRGVDSKRMILLK